MENLAKDSVQVGKAVFVKLTVRSKTKSCFEDLRAIGIIMVKKDLSRKMRTNFLAFEDSKSLFSSKC